MKPEYIKIMQRKIHAANVLMERQKYRPYSNFDTFVMAVVPSWSLSERVDDELYNRYKIACAITGIDRRERDTTNDRYNVYMHKWSMCRPKGVLPITPEEWKIKERVQ